MSTHDFERASAADEELCQVRKSILAGEHEESPRAYRNVWEELTVIGYVLLRQCRIVIPQMLRSRVLALAHEGHQGIVKCKDRLRTKVWWPGVDRDVKHVSRVPRVSGDASAQSPSSYD